MKQVQIELPDELVVQLETLVRKGWFRSESELVRVAVLDFVRRHGYELQERFQREDIKWALEHKPSGK